MLDNISDALLSPRTLLCDDQVWRYPGEGASRGGYARLRIWSTEQGPLLVLVTELGLGMSVMNAAPEIHQLLQARLRGHDFVVLEHWPVGDGLEKDVDTLDYVFLDDNGPQWNRISPLDSADPVRERWMDQTGRHLIEAGGPWRVDQDTAAQLRAVLM